jgi:hypothetical protein
MRHVKTPEYMGPDKLQHVMSKRTLGKHKARETILPSLQRGVLFRPLHKRQ